MKWFAALALLTTSCTLVNQSDFRERIDGDLDGLPVDRDCNDVGEIGQRITHLEGIASTQANDEACPTDLACGDSVTCTLEPTTEGQLVNSLCTDPGNPNRVLSFGDRSRVHRIVAPSGQEVSISALASVTTIVDDAPPEILLMANRGRSCTLDSCELAYPLRQESEENDGVDPPSNLRTPTVWLQTDDAPLYAVVSNDAGTYTITVECFSNEPTDFSPQ